MKSKISAILLLLLVFSLINCEKENSKISIINFSNTDCKVKSFDSVSIESVTFKALNESQMEVAHSNAFFNCCLEELFAECNLKNDTIFINEISTDNYCDCICPYDLNYTVDNLVSKKYTISLQDNYFFEIDFNSEMDTTFYIGN